MAKATGVLAPAQSEARKSAAGLDLATDYASDPACLACHTTGYGTPSGYPPPPAAGKEWTKEERERADRNRGVTCEACHGPGSLYVPHKKADPKGFRIADVVRLGATSPPTAAQCLPCHVREADAEGRLVKGCPTMPKDYAFDFEKAKADSRRIHLHVPLKDAH